MKCGFKIKGGNEGEIKENGPKNQPLNKTRNPRIKKKKRMVRDFTFAYDAIRLFTYDPEAIFTRKIPAIA